MKKKILRLPVNSSCFLPKSFKKYLLAICFLPFYFSGFTQSIDFGLSGGISSAWLLNGNVFSGRGGQSYNFAISDNYGLHTAINFAHGYGIEIEIQKAVMNQAYGGVFGGSGSFPAVPITYFDGESFSANTVISVLKFPVLFRYYRDLNGKYFEGGLAYEIIQGADYTAEYKNPDQAVGYNIISQMPKGDFVAIAGLGWDKNFKHDGNLYIHFGFRLEYGLFDLMGVDGHGQNLTGARSVILYEQPGPYYKAYHSTHSLELSFNIGLFYRVYPKSMLHKKTVDF